MTGGGLGEGSIRVRRGRSDSAMLRDIIVNVDGQEAARLAQGAEAVLKVTAGSHVVQAAMDWATSIPLEVPVVSGGEAVVEVAIPWNAMWRSFTAPKSALTARLLV